MSAAEIARSLGLTRAAVNSELYSQLGRRYRQSEEQPPRWSLLLDDVGATVGAARPPRLLASRDFHIDFAGGDWRLRIQVGENSRNDPIARVEYMGERHRLITVAAYACGSVTDAALPDAAVALAASVLAWEIHQDLRERGIESFHFEEAVRDIFLSLATQSQQEHSTVDGPA